MPSTVARRLALADEHVAANGIVQAFDAGLERENDRADHHAEEDLQRRDARENLRFVELDADRRQRRHLIEDLQFDDRNRAIVPVNRDVGTMSAQCRDQVGGNRSAKVDRDRCIEPIDMDPGS
jgi:hypothetical protein